MSHAGLEAAGGHSLCDRIAFIEDADEKGLLGLQVGDGRTVAPRQGGGARGLELEGEPLCRDLPLDVSLHIHSKTLDLQDCKKGIQVVTSFPASSSRTKIRLYRPECSTVSEPGAMVSMKKYITSFMSAEDSERL